METKWTKVPWTAIERHGQIEVSNNVEGTDICDVCVWNSSIDDLLEAQANAHLISAAPDLYTAHVLRDAESIWEKRLDFGTEKECKESFDILFDLCTKAGMSKDDHPSEFVYEYQQRAMQKARGEQNG